MRDARVTGPRNEIDIATRRKTGALDPRLKPRLPDKAIVTNKDAGRRERACGLRLGGKE